MEFITLKLTGIFCINQSSSHYRKVYSKILNVLKAHLPVIDFYFVRIFYHNCANRQKYFKIQRPKTTQLYSVSPHLLVNRHTICQHQGMALGKIPWKFLT